jgi:cytochrome c-type biogenesis protein CcmH
MKRFVAARIAAGDTKSEIKDQLVAQFGRGVLAAPEKEGFDLLAWVVPLVGLAAGAVVLSLLLWRWTRRVDEELPLLE